MNYSETYFKLDSEEATHSHPLSPIVTLSVVCTLKGMSRKSIQKIKAMLLFIEYGILFVKAVYTKIKAYNALNAMFVDTVDTGVCGLSSIDSVDMLSVFNSTFPILDEPHIFASNPFWICIDSVDMKAVHLVLMLYY